MLRAGLYLGQCVYMAVKRSLSGSPAWNPAGFRADLQRFAGILDVLIDNACDRFEEEAYGRCIHRCDTDGTTDFVPFAKRIFGIAEPRL